MNIRTQIGPVTAYADAVAAGYTGTREQWAEDMAKLGENLAAVRTEREKAEDAAQTAVDARDTAMQTINTTRDAAVQTVNEAAETAENAAIESIEQAAAEKVGEINGIGAVRFDGHQSLTEDEQATARSNIGAASADEVGKLSDEIADENKRAVERENEIEGLFTMPTQEAVNKWLEEHPEATTTVQDKSLTIDKMVVGTLGYVTPEMFGAVGNGVTDDTEAINKALAVGGLVMFPADSYLVSVAELTALEVPSNTIVYLGTTTINLAANNLTRYYTFNVENAENVTIYGGTINGDREYHTGTTGEWGFGVRIHGSTNCTVKNSIIKNMWGDGVCVSGDSQNVIIDGCDISYCRRQGITLATCSKIVVRNCKIHNISGINPQAGIDVEPDSGIARDIHIHNNYFADCANNAITMYSKNDGTVTIEGIVIHNNQFTGTFSSAIIFFTRVSRAIIKNNTFDNITGSSTISAQASSEFTVFGNDIMNSVTSYGMYFYEMDGLLISDNNIKNCVSQYCIWTHKCANMMISNNTIKSCKWDNSETNAYVFYVRGETEEVPSDNCIIKNNVVDALEGFYGFVMLSLYARYCKIVDNLVTNTDLYYTVYIVHVNCVGNVIIGNFFPVSDKAVGKPNLLEVTYVDNYIDFVKQ